MDEDERLRRLKRELDLIGGRTAKPVRLAAAHVPWFIRAVLPKSARRMLADARDVERRMNAALGRPVSEDDHLLLAKGRGADAVREDIAAFAPVEAVCHPIGEPDLGGCEVRRLWFLRWDRWTDRAEGFYMAERGVFEDAGADAILTQVLASGAADTGIRLGRHEDERSRSAFLRVEGKPSIIFSVAAHALLLELLDPDRHGTDMPRAVLVLPGSSHSDLRTLRPVFALIAKADGAVQWFEIDERRL